MYTPITLFVAQTYIINNKNYGENDVLIMYVVATNNVVGVYIF
jgi:hypothetical protein